MIASPKSRMVLLATAFVIVGVAIAVVVQLRRAPTADTTLAGPVTTPAPAVRDQASATLAAAEKEATAVVAALGAPPAPQDNSDGVPTFDIARIEPTGEAVIAGRAAPGVTVELLRNGDPVDRAVTNAEGQFAMVPPRLPAGTYDLTLRAKQADGKQATSKQSVAVAIAPSANERPVVALMTPDKPTIVLSQPGAQKPATGALVVEAVEMQGSKLHVSGRARPGAVARFYLNDSFVAAATAAADGRFTITINEGVTPGNYRVRLDEVEPASGAVRARAEVPFNVPAPAVAATAPSQTATPAPSVAAAKQPQRQPAPSPPVVAAATTPAAPPVTGAPQQAAAAPATVTAAKQPQQQAAPSPPSLAAATTTPAAAPTPVATTAPTVTAMKQPQQQAAPSRPAVVAAPTTPAVAAPQAATVPPAVTAVQQPQQQAAPSRPAVAAATMTPAAPSQPATAAPTVTAVQQPQQQAQPSAPAVAAPTATPAAAADARPPSVVVVPRIATATVYRGDSLWRISRFTYGAGIRYAVIYEANQSQIRDPDLIYPGQIFVLPAQ